MLLNFKKVFWFLGGVVFLSILFLPGYTKLQELRDKNLDLEVKIRKLNIENSLNEFEPCKSCFIKESYQWKKIL